MTKFAAVSTTPSGGTAYIRAVQFVQTSRRTAMVLLMSSAGTMKNRVFHCDFDLNPEMLRVFFRLLNEKLVNKPVADITPAFIQSLAVSLGDMSMLMSSALMAVLDVARDTRETNVFQSGQMNLLFYPEYERGAARRVMDFLERPRELADLLVQEPGSVQAPYRPGKPGAGAGRLQRGGGPLRSWRSGCRSAGGDWPHPDELPKSDIPSFLFVSVCEPAAHSADAGGIAIEAAVC